MPGLWAEGTAYSTEVIYDICLPNGASPPVHYESHTIKPHSICHFDAPGHIIPGAKTIDQLFSDHLNFFYGPVIVLKFKNADFKLESGSEILHWKIEKQVLEESLRPFNLSSVEKVFISFEGAASDFFSNATHALTLSIDAARWLASLPKFNLFGTIWKSTDFQPGKRERPIHKEIFKRAGIIECLDLTMVPAGKYFLSAFPIPTVGSTESPVCPVLFSEDEIRWD